ncbi:IspD/TarI family cytidylyltransferase [Melissococcus plutonius]|uniref:2-C-methyl-D-erythritol 4-phosphatecytidylyltransferase n=1 Tax=Melissococcus plutonius (strain ATCC 35311 / DSM 29964 / CIP 104052 / LMG 20360 / NCIMB 702443) TaxID=940190 RepID=F3Y9V6_MELPT|nr:2-C-methyl-D-erythritol 4-phosphate cytidylyltransferase [Melissococcus plutonius]AIM24813.1 2-C-methyl-D-erythritol 4-phosphate cytidylyltransferase IspD [Melissococcus plutonius S1]KMT24932.1 2-C-methyl-D-erythritol 4-phosphate cytidylyltransferase IspD [Melissococcus plutonius]KMT26569.1 2-C-methyl-D-erythritol 4-phosphate cytidylyltransferase IspD [Melissococcus plutonius]KMT27819.1 2-C-methyl-D-erythritol 4-phosphate cytidylyltransferase IspD [Melissococcus plutonius]KMT29591.1 2-C-met
MITAIIIAGGVGKRMGQEIPKQFIIIDGKPIIIYTLISFQNHPQIDKILVVCKSGWEGTMWAYIKEYNISKVEWVIAGGKTGQESINAGVQFLKQFANNEDIIVIHDGIRPLVEEIVLSDVIVKCRKFGNAVSSLPYNEQIFIKKTDETTQKYIDRETLRRVATPQAYNYGKLIQSYDRAFKEGIGISESSYTNTMMVDLGETLHFALGSDKNIKLTTLDDLELFKGYLRMKTE